MSFFAKQSNTLNLPAMENGFSLIPSQDSLFRLEPVMVTKKKKKKKTWPNSAPLKSYPAVEPKKAVNQQCYMQSATTPFKTIV